MCSDVSDKSPNDQDQMGRGKDAAMPRDHLPPSSASPSSVAYRAERSMRAVASSIGMM